jgi:hypothetical protein
MTTHDHDPLAPFAKDVAVLVSSCDAFFDAWRPFAFFFRKFWNDCPFPVYLIANRLEVRSRWMRLIRVGRDKGWASNMIGALRKISQPYVLYMQEDYFLTGPVRRGQLAADFAFSYERNAASFCFYGRSTLETNFEWLNDSYGVVPRDSNGRTRCQVTLWKREVLASALREGETAWNMEARGSDRVRDVLCLSYVGSDKGPVPYLMSGISRGLWMPEALALCHQHHLAIRPKFRPNYSPSSRVRRFRRAIGRVRFPLAYARQLTHPIELD